MKRCPACDRTYSDEAALNFCLDDGAPLLHVESGALDAQQTLRISAPRPTEQGRTDVLPPHPSPSSNPPPSYRPAPYSPSPSGYQPAAMGARPSRSPWPWIIGISAVLFLGMAFLAAF